MNESQKKNLAKGKQFDKHYQPKNRRKKSIITLVKKKLFDESEYMTLTKVEVIGDDGVPTGEIVKGRVKLLNAEALATLYMKKIKTDKKVMLDAIDRIDGKATQKVIQETELNLENYDISLLSLDEQKQLLHLLDKVKDLNDEEGESD